MTVDPYMRGRMVDRASYVPPFKLGEPLQGGAIGEVALRQPFVSSLISLAYWRAGQNKTANTYLIEIPI
jgi:NADPH-dependent curcumin reductase CurA